MQFILNVICQKKLGNTETYREGICTVRRVKVSCMYSSACISPAGMTAGYRWPVLLFAVSTLCLQTQCVRYCADDCVSVVMNSSAKSFFVLVLQSSFPPLSWCSYYHVLFGRRSMQKPAALVQFYNILPDVKRLLEGWCGSFIMAGAVENTIDERQEDTFLAVRAKPEMITLE